MLNIDFLLHHAGLSGKCIYNNLLPVVAEQSHMFNNNLKFILGAEAPMFLCKKNGSLFFHNDPFQHLISPSLPVLQGTNINQTWPAFYTSITSPHANINSLFPNWELSLMYTDNDELLIGFFSAKQEISPQTQTDYQTILQELPLAITILKAMDWEIQFVNEEILDTIIQRKRKDVIGLKAFDLFPELQEQRFPKILESIVKTGEPYHEKEAVLTLKVNGTYQRFYLDFDYKPVLNNNNEVTHIIVTLHNVTDRLLAKQQTEDAEERMRMAIESVGTATWDLNLSNHDLQHSPGFAELIGFDQAKQVSYAEFISSFIDDETKQHSEMLIHQAITSGACEFEGRIKTTHQEIRWLKVLGKVTFDKANNPIRLLGIVTDITKQKNEEKSSLYLASIIESTDDAIVSKTTQGIVTSWNKAAERLFGYSAEEMIGETLEKIFTEDNEHEETVILNNIRNGRKVDHFETVRRHKSGKLIHVSLTISPIRDKSGNIIGASKIARDITEKKLIEKQIEETRNQLEIVIKASGLGTWELDLKTYSMSYSDRFLEIVCGNQLDSPTYKEIKKLIHPDDLIKRNEAYKEVLVSGYFNLAVRVIWPDNSIHFIEAKGKLNFDNKFGNSKMLGTIRDVTDQKNYEHNLALSEQRFRTVSDTAPVMIWMVDPQHEYTFINKHWSGFTGLQLLPDLSKQATSRIHPDDYPKTIDAYLSAFNQHQPLNLEYRLKRQDGEYRWVSDIATPLFNNHGIYQGHIGACMDITDRILFEQQLKESESRLRLAALSSELGTWTYDVASKKTVFDDSARKLFGIAADAPITIELLKSKLYKDDVDSILAQIANTLNPEIAEAFDAEFRVVGLTNNTIRWIHAKGKTSFNKNNEPEIFAGTVLDITDKQLALEDLQESELKFRLLADSLPQFIWTSDEKGSLNYFNQSSIAYTGKSIEQLMENGWITLVHPDDYKPNLEAWEMALKKGKPFHFEHRFKRHDGEYRWHLSRAIPQHDATGLIQMWVGTSTDVHDQKTFVDELERQVKLRTHELDLANEELLRSNAELAQFAYVASHDLQEPLRKIQTFTTRIVETSENKLSERSLDYFKRIQSASQRMQQLIIDLLSFSRTNTSEKHFESVDLNKTINTIKEQLKESIKTKQAIITSDQLPHLLVIGFQFEQLLTNLISNALKFSKQHTPPVITISHKTLKGEDMSFYNAIPHLTYHQFTISDNGIGFSNEYKERIFQVFQRLHGKDKYEGTGIGLAIVKKIIENHNGFIDAHGEENVGAEFVIYIPETQPKPKGIA